MWGVLGEQKKKRNPRTFQVLGKDKKKTIGLFIPHYTTSWQTPHLWCKITCMYKFPKNPTIDVNRYKRPIEIHLKNGIPPKDIAVVLGLSKKRVYQLVNYFDLGFLMKKQQNHKKNSKRKWTEDKLQVIKAMANDPRVNTHDMAAHFGVTQKSILRVLRKEKIRSRRKRKALVRTKAENKVTQLLYRKGRTSLELEDFRPLPTHCPILGIELDYAVSKSPSDNSPSLDRLDHSKGYVKGNVVLCSVRANRIKNNGSVEEHRKIADFMEQWQKKQYETPKT